MGLTMWEWLNTNSDAVQAITSILSVLVTIALVCITGRYVKLTKALAEAARADSLRNVEASTARWRDFLSQIGFLSKALTSLPDSTNWSQADTLMRKATSWDDFDFASFRRLAAEISGDASTAVVALELEMKRIGVWVNAVKSSRGYDWSSFSKEDFENATLAARTAIAELIMELSSQS